MLPKTRNFLEENVISGENSGPFWQRVQESNVRGSGAGLSLALALALALALGKRWRWRWRWENLNCLWLAGWL